MKNLCKEYRPAVETVLNVPDSHSVLVEHVDHVKHVLHSEREALLWKHHGRSVKMLYLSDINKFSRYSMAVRMVINLGDDLPHLLEWLITFVDRMAKLKMTSNERR